MVQSLQYKVSLGGLAASTRVTELEEQVKTLQAKLLEEQQSTKTRIAELDRRQQSLASRESALTIRNMWHESKLKKAKEEQERELEALRADLEVQKTVQLATLEEKERQLNVRESNLIAREAKLQSKKTVAKPSVARAPLVVKSQIRITKTLLDEPSRNLATVIHQESSGSRSANSEEAGSKACRVSMSKEAPTVLATPRRIKSAEELRKKPQRNNLKREKSNSSAHSIPIAVADIFGSAEESDIIAVKAVAKKAAPKPKRRLAKQTENAFKQAPPAIEEKIARKPVKTLTQKVSTLWTAAVVASPAARPYRLRDRTAKK